MGRQSTVGGYISRRLYYPPLGLPPYRAGGADESGDDITPGPDENVGPWVLALTGVRWVVVLLDDPEYDPGRTGAELVRYADLAAGPIYRDAQTIVYRPKPPLAPTFFVRPADGWHTPEELPDQRGKMRWLPRSAALDVWSLSSVPQAGLLRFDAWSFAQPRRLQVVIDGQPVGEQLIADPQRHEFPVTLDPGEHRIALRSLDPPQRPVAGGYSDDNRLISIGVAKVELLPAPTPSPRP